jgi:hypothetical protein
MKLLLVSPHRKLNFNSSFLIGIFFKKYYINKITNNKINNPEYISIFYDEAFRAF